MIRLLITIITIVQPCKTLAIHPLWTSQRWFTLLLNLLTNHPLVLPQLDTLLVQPHSNAVHSLSKRFQLIACKVSGNPSASEPFQAKLPASSCSLGELVPKNMSLISRSGGKLIHTIHLWTKWLPYTTINSAWNALSDHSSHWRCEHREKLHRLPLHERNL